MEKRKYLVFGVVFAVALLADQLTKVWARATLKGKPIVTVVADWWDFRYSENPGVAFGMFRDVPGAKFILPLVALLALGVIVSFVRKTRPDRLRLVAELGLLAGGAVGNFMDRVLFHKVTDFVVWKAPNESWICRAIVAVSDWFGSAMRYCEWPTFNVADAWLVVGVIALLIDVRADDMEPIPADATPASPTKDK